MMSPRGRNAIGRRRAISAPSRSEEAAINPHANASTTSIPQTRRGRVGHSGLAAPLTLKQTGQPIHHLHDAIVGNPAPLSEAYSPNLREGRRRRKSSLSGRVPATHSESSGKAKFVELRKAEVQLRRIHLLRGWVNRDEKKEVGAATTHRPPSL